MAAKLEIVLQDDGRVYVSGPIENKILSFGMLEMAKIAVMQYNKNELIQKVPANAQIVDLPVGN